MALLLFLNLLIAQQSNAFRNHKILNRDPTRVCACVCVYVYVYVQFILSRQLDYTYNKGIFRTLSTSKRDLSTKTGKQP